MIQEVLRERKGNRELPGGSVGGRGCTPSARPPPRAPLPACTSAKQTQPSHRRSAARGGQALGGPGGMATPAPGGRSRSHSSPRPSRPGRPAPARAACISVPRTATPARRRQRPRPRRAPGGRGAPAAGRGRGRGEDRGRPHSCPRSRFWTFPESQGLRGSAAPAFWPVQEPQHHSTASPSYSLDPARHGPALPQGREEGQVFGRCPSVPHLSLQPTPQVHTQQQHIHTRCGGVSRVRTGYSGEGLRVSFGAEEGLL